MSTSSPPSNAPTWWQSLAERQDPEGVRAEAHAEFPQSLPVNPGAGPKKSLPIVGQASEPPRRDFFKMMGLSATAALAACKRAPKQNILPYTQKPDALIPGVSSWYASTCQACPARCGLLVKTRDGRPIKVEGNPQHPVSQGAVCTIGQASLLGLYDADRARTASRGGQPVAWSAVDELVKGALARATAAETSIYLVVPFGLGPSEEAALTALAARHPRAKRVRFDALGDRRALAEAHQLVHGQALIPDYRLDQARMLVSFGADFLGTWLNPAAFSRQWAAARDLARPREVLHHVQIEAMLSLSGGAADVRHPVPPSALRPTLAALVHALAEGRSDAVAQAAKAAAAKVGGASALDGAPLAKLAHDLRAAGDRGLVLAGQGGLTLQVLAALANALLGNGATTARIDQGVPAASDLDWTSFLSELGAAPAGAVVFLGTNPVMADRRLRAGLAKAAFSLSTSSHLDETAALCHVHAPEGHPFEGWSDSLTRQGVFAVNQPTVAPLFDTRSRLSSLLAWADDARDDHAFVGEEWRAVLGEALGDGDFAALWNARLRDGVFVREAPEGLTLTLGAPEAIAAAVEPAAGPAQGLELALYASVGLGDGSAANNGWLQELPDPITKMTWGNAAALGPALAAQLGVKDGDLVQVSGEVSVTLPVLVQAGVAPRTVALAVGHGRARGGRHAAGHGVDVWPLAVHGGRFALGGQAVNVTRTGGATDLYLSQIHNSQEGRALVRQATLEEFLHNPAHAGHPEEHALPGKGLWSKHPYEGHRWALAIDLDKCTGCGACVVSCQSENNIPMVGPVEVGLRREMHWLRIDRYYGGTAENPEVLHQPMMCQHCENAPCETVCPVLATVHSAEGLNQQIYNRCVGTRYCANNCPTKVRRFNWFDYPHDEPLERMVLNPDVVVRSRGVMEKCSMCVHRIEESRAQTKREGRTLAEGDVKTACQQSCPGNAIVFGDINDPQSAVSQAAQNPRAYQILTDLNIGPSVSYLVRIKNTRHG